MLSFSFALCLSLADCFVPPLVDIKMMWLFGFRARRPFIASSILHHEDNIREGANVCFVKEFSREPKSPCCRFRLPIDSVSLGRTQVIELLFLAANTSWYLLLELQIACLCSSGRTPRSFCSDLSLLRVAAMLLQSMSWPSIAKWRPRLVALRRDQKSSGTCLCIKISFVML